ncbi:MAG TPA: hypothetical protein VN805_02365 [Caulobacteraceae bacterium]|nr:hypothetical protein [Caulobacteraceae bacterium]
MNGAPPAGALVMGILLLAGSPATAEPAVGAGVGTYSCNEFTRASAADEQRELLYFSWARGWMTAWDLDQMQAGRPTRDLSQPSVPDQRAFLSKWCASHPRELYMKGVYELYLTLSLMPAK